MSMLNKYMLTKANIILLCTNNRHPFETHFVVTNSVGRCSLWQDFAEIETSVDATMFANMLAHAIDDSHHPLNFVGLIRHAWSDYLTFTFCYLL